MCSVSHSAACADDCACICRTQSLDSHHKSDGGAEGNALGYEDFNDGYDACCISVHRYGTDNGQGYCQPVVFRQVGLEKSLWHIAVHGGSDADTYQHIDEHSTDDIPGIAQYLWQTLHEADVFRLPFCRLCRRLCLYLPHPVSEQRLQMHPSEYHAANHSQQNTAHYIDERNLPTEQAEEHRHSHLVDQWRGDEEG